MEATAVETWDLSSTSRVPWYARLLPSLTDLAFILPALLLFRFLGGGKTLLGDGDTGWHIRTGDWILQHRTVPAVDFFSFTKSGQPWFAWEWGWDVLFAAVHRYAGLAGVVLINVILLGFISALLFRLIRRSSDNDILAFLFTVIATCGCTVHWWARPHLFSWLFVLLFAHAILSAEQGNRAALWSLPFLTIVWTNLHGAFFLGILMLVASAIGAAASLVLTNVESPWRLAYARSAPYLGTALACVLATFINPYTWRLHRHIYSYLLDSKLLDNIGEYRSVSFHDGPIIFFEFMLLLGVASALWCLQRGKLSAAILIALFAHLALFSGRNIPLFLLIAAPWVAAMIQDALPRLKMVPALRKVGGLLSGVADEFRPFERVGRAHCLSAAAMLCLAVLLAAGKPGFESEFDGQRFPASAIPVIERFKASRTFTYDQWGDYLIYRLYPVEKVFVDGRSDFYGADFLNTYEHILGARYDYRAELKRFAVDTVLIKPDAPLATVLKQSADWKVLLDDGHLIVFRTARAAQNGTPALRGNARFSSVLRNGRKQLAASNGFEADSSSSNLKTQERRSL
ncbi:MAG: hypothetical protein WB992_06665 [Bryobacteraceae bacterium]